MIPVSSMALGARGTLQKFNTQAQNLLKNNPEKQKTKVARLVGRLLDYNELAQASLGKHWKDRTEPEQKEFVRTLRDLIEKNYIDQLKDQVDYDITYHDEEKLKDNRVQVGTTLITGRPPRQTETEVVYVMKRKGGEWLVIDVITDDVSLTRNYRSQFGKIISEKGYGELIAKMKKKLNEN